MISIVLPDNGKLLIYDDAIHMPAVRYKEFQKYLLQDSGIGSTMDDVSLRFSTFLKHLAAGKINEARTDAENLFYTHWAIIEKVSFKHLAFGCLIHSVDGQVMTSYDAEDLTVALKTLSERGLTQELVDSSVADSKKNSTPN